MGIQRQRSLIRKRSSGLKTLHCTVEMEIEREFELDEDFDTPNGSQANGSQECDIANQSAVGSVVFYYGGFVVGSVSLGIGRGSRLRASLPPPFTPQTWLPDCREQLHPPASLSSFIHSCMEGNFRGRGRGGWGLTTYSYSGQFVQKAICTKPSQNGYLPLNLPSRKRHGKVFFFYQCPE